MNNRSSYSIVPLTADRLDALQTHLAHHHAESGQGEIHFKPFDPAQADRPKGLHETAWQLPLTELGWQRWFVAQSSQHASATVLGHLSLKGPSLRTALHRCELGIGLERKGRNRGIGTALMHHAIAFARATPTLEWIDLNVFAHNEIARNLYHQLGFVQMGTRIDSFRLSGESLDDVQMSLDLRRSN